MVSWPPPIPAATSSHQQPWIHFTPASTATWSRDATNFFVLDFNLGDLAMITIERNADGSLSTPFTRAVRELATRQSRTGTPTPQELAEVTEAVAKSNPDLFSQHIRLSDGWE